MVDIAKIGFAVDTAGLKQGEAALDSFNQKQKQVAAGAKDLNAAQKDVPVNAAATTGALGSAAKAADSLALSHNSAATSTRTFREALHALAPVAYTAGVPIHGLGIFARAASGGMVALAAALSIGLIASLEKAAEDSFNLKGRLQDLLGVKAGEAASRQLQTAADQAHTTVATLQPALETLINLQSKIDYAAGMRMAPNADAAAHQRDITMVRALTEALQLNGQAGSEAGKAVAGYIAEMGKIDQATGRPAGLTLDLFDKIRDAAPAAARAIAQALGAGSGPDAIANMEATLSRGAIDFNTFRDAIVANAAAIDAKFKEMPPSLAQSWDQVGNSWHKLTAELGKDLGHPIAASLDAITHSVSAILPLLAQLDSAGGKAFSDLQKAAVDAAAAIFPAVKSIADSIANAVARLTPANAGANAQLYADSLSGGGSYFPGISFDAGSTASGLNSSSDLLQFATGGLATVQGTGGTDSQLVQFMATPGEVVAVGMPGTSAGSGGGHVTNIAGVSMTVVQSLAQLNNALQAAAAKVSSSSSAMASATSAAANILLQPRSTPLLSGGQTVPWSGWTENNNPNNDSFNPNADYGGYYGSFASGGSFRVGGSGGTDSQFVGFHASPGEHVNVSNGPGNNAPGKYIGRSRKLTLALQMPQSANAPPAFVMSGAQAARAFRMMMR